MDGTGLIAQLPVAQDKFTKFTKFTYGWTEASRTASASFAFVWQRLQASISVWVILVSTLWMLRRRCAALRVAALKIRTVPVFVILRSAKPRLVSSKPRAFSVLMPGSPLDINQSLALFFNALNGICQVPCVHL